MNTAPAYLIKRFLFRIKEFLRHWYVKSGKIYWNFIINQFEKIDYKLAWKITIKNIFKPLYKDYSVMGYILGFIFRSLRVVFSSIVYVIYFVFALGLYILWLLMPAVVIYGALTNQPIT